MSSRRSTRVLLLLLVFSVLCLLDVHKILVLGKNGDGAEYAAVARNMAQGRGSLWAPYLSDTNWAVHYEHPPLIYWIQSVFFRVFGESVYFEGYYGFGIAIVILGLMGMFWQRIRHDFQLAEVGNWWPWLLILAIPEFTYFAQSNRLVVTFLVFALVSTYLAYRSIMHERWGAIYALLAGATVYGGFIAKGPVAAFAWAVPAIGWLTLRVRLSRALYATLVAFGTTVTFQVVVTYFFPQNLDFWADFMPRQVMASLLGNRSAESWVYYYIKIGGMIGIMTGVAAVTMLIFWVSLWRIRWNRQCTFFLLVMLAGCIPFCLSPRQRFRYILHSLPFLVLCFATLSAAAAIKVEEVMESRRKLRLASVLASVVFVLFSIGHMIYQKDTLTRAYAYFEDIYLRDVGPPPWTTVTVHPESMIWSDYLFAFMQRYQKLNVTGETGHDYILVDKNSGDFTAPEWYEQILETPTRKYLLYKRVEPNEPPPDDG